MYILRMSSKMVSIHEAAEFLGVAAQTLRRWEREGKLAPDERTPGGRRRYDLTRLRPEQFHAREAARRTVAYARVSSHDQKDDLERQKQVLELYCARQGWTFEGVRFKVMWSLPCPVWIVPTPERGNDRMVATGAVCPGRIHVRGSRHSGESRNPATAAADARGLHTGLCLCQDWIPAFAGMTGGVLVIPAKNGVHTVAFWERVGVRVLEHITLHRTRGLH